MDIETGAGSSDPAISIALPAFRRSKRSWPEERVDQLCALMRAGKSYAQISKRLGMTRSAISGQVDRLRLRHDSRLPPLRAPDDTGAAARIRNQLIPRPDDFAERAAGSGNPALCKHYGVCDRLISRWRKETGLVAYSVATAIPENFATLAPTMRLYEAQQFFQRSPIVLKRWALETGVRFRQPAVIRNRGSSEQIVRETRRDMSLVGQAAEYLQRFCAVYRCDKIGRADPAGKLWRRGNAVLTDSELVERAERNGWDADAWERVAA